jgi:alkylated DNA repair protein (DNA oxidative demethylase)
MPPEQLALFAEPSPEGVTILRGFALAQAVATLAEVERLSRAAPFRVMQVPGGGTMSVAMTNCGAAGWVTDQTGYRYSPADPLTGQPWPEMPALIRDLAVRAASAAGFEGFPPDACLINRYEPGARMGLHQDRDEVDRNAPIVSVSLGLSATFLFGGLKRSDPQARIALNHGDVVVWGGPVRMAYHGIAPLKDGLHPDLGRRRLNLTIRKAR